MDSDRTFAVLLAIALVVAVLASAAAEHRRAQELDRAASMGELRRGMTADQVVRAWGHPDRTEIRAGVGNPIFWYYDRRGCYVLFLQDSLQEAVCR